MEATQELIDPAKKKKLAKLGVGIRKVLDEYNALLSKSVAQAFKLGEMLAEAKEILGSKQFSKWCLVEFDMTRDCAHRYVTMHHNRDKIKEHPEFGKLNILQMFDVARDKTPRTRSYKMCGATLDSLINTLEERIAEKVLEHPELEDIAAAITRWRKTLYRCGLLRREV